MRIRIAAWAFMLVTASIVAAANHLGYFGGLTSASEGSSDEESSELSSDSASPLLPARRVRDEPLPLTSDLPSNAGDLAPLTIEATVRQRMSSGQVLIRETITRTPTRVHLARSEGPEWLYERNPVDGRRVSGFLIDHAAQAIVYHSDSDLRSLLNISGWEHILSFGVERSVLAQLEPSSDARTIGGLRFSRLLSRKQDGSIDLWWNQEQLLPAEFVTADDRGRTAFSIQSIRPGIDESVLRAPNVRFPTYRDVDLADWLEHR